MKKSIWTYKYAEKEMPKYSLREKSICKNRMDDAKLWMAFLIHSVLQKLKFLSLFPKPIPKV